MQNIIWKSMFIIFFYEIKLNDKVKKVFFTILNDFTSYI